MPIMGSIYYLLGGVPPGTAMQQHYRLLAGLVTEITSLMVLWYVMSRQGETLKGIGWSPAYTDVPRGIDRVGRGVENVSVDNVIDLIRA